MSKSEVKIDKDASPPKKRLMMDKKNDTIKENNSIHETDLNLSTFQMTKLLNSNSNRKIIWVEGIFEGYPEPAIVMLEKKIFPDEDALIQKGFLNKETAIHKIYHNDIYGNYECFPKVEHNGLNATIIHPATQKHIEKFSKKDLFLVEETYELYKTITLPYIKSQQFSLAWVDNILTHKAESERIIYEDTNKETGFIMLPDLKWDGQPATLNILVLTHKRIISIRELNATHLPLLKNIRDTARRIVKEKYNVHPSQIRMYLHYQPSYYHLHVHVTFLMNDAPGIYTEKAHLLSTVISNIELLSDYYQKATLSFVIYKGDLLCKKFQEHKILSLDEESITVEGES